MSTNQLNHVRDKINASNFPNDIDNQNPNNYTYDPTGNLIKDQAENLSISWTHYGKVKDVNKNGNSLLSFKYDATGNRLIKENHQTQEKQIYLRDAQGNIMAVYKDRNDSLFLDELHLYGSSRLGMIKEQQFLTQKLTGGTPPPPQITPVYTLKLYNFGKKRYELADWLGNVRVVINDKKTPMGNNTQNMTYAAQVLEVNDYYPFGMLSRSYSDGGYRFGFNTQEKDDEIYGEGNSYTAQFWEYSSRVVQRWNQEPKPNPSLSRYAILSGNPIWFNDPLGDTIIVDKKGFITRNDKTDNLVFTMQNGKLVSLGELGKTVDINNIYKNLLSENAKEAKAMWNPLTFRNKVKKGGDWDLKANENTIYGLANIMANKGEIKQTQFLFEGKKMEAQDVGNHHFGVVGKAYGLFPETFMLKQAGEAQMNSGTSKPEWQIYKTERVPIFTKTDRLIWVEQKVMLPPYGDDPRDQYWIKLGFQYFDKNKSNLLK